MSSIPESWSKKTGLVLPTELVVLGMVVVLLILVLLLQSPGGPGPGAEADVRIQRAGRIEREWRRNVEAANANRDVSSLFAFGSHPRLVL
jgi:hypothetical protein